jgi:hypothetical protein
MLTSLTSARVAIWGRVLALDAFTTRKTAIGSTATRSAPNMWCAAGIYLQRTCAYALRVSHIPAAHHIFSALRVYVGPDGVPSPNLPVAHGSSMRCG